MTNFKVVLDIGADEAKWASEMGDYVLGDLWDGAVKADLMDHIERSIQLAYPTSSIDIWHVNIEETLDEDPEGTFV